MWGLSRGWIRGSAAVAALSLVAGGATWLHLDSGAAASSAPDKIVYSRSLERVTTARTRLERTFDADAVRRLKSQAPHDLSEINRLILNAGDSSSNNVRDDVALLGLELTE